ncbi:hypothetical protein OH492_29240 [Vibrio chagasii]|nr:hypothetical protein [Vibrio chagasii]
MGKRQAQPLNTRPTTDIHMDIEFQFLKETRFKYGQRETTDTAGNVSTETSVSFTQIIRVNVLTVSLSNDTADTPSIHQT